MIHLKDIICPNNGNIMYLKYYSLNLLIYLIDFEYIPLLPVLTYFLQIFSYSSLFIYNLLVFKIIVIPYLSLDKLDDLIFTPCLYKVDKFPSIIRTYSD